MDTAWKVEFTPQARRTLHTLRDSIRAEVLQAVTSLGEDPYPPGAVELRGHRAVYRIKVYRESYRIIYRVAADRDLVIVQRIAPRKDAYRGL
jgi:mRNA interferase RelE/StbE